MKPIFKPGGRCGESYDIANLIHQGPNAETYTAIHRITRDLATVTCSRFSHVEGDPPSEATFVATAEKLVALAVNDVPRIYGFGVSDGVYWIASAFYDEPTIIEMHAQRQDQSPEWRILDALAVAIQVQSVLVKTHALHVFHGNLRPSCILICGLPNDCDPCILELGYADLFMLNRTAARASPRYRPPEQIAGDPIDARSDIYSLGMSVYHLIAQAPPYADVAPVSTSVRLLEMAERELPTPLPELTKHCPKRVWEFVAKAIDKNPARRFQSADEMGHALEDLTERILEDRRIGAFVNEQERRLVAQVRAQGQALKEPRNGPRVADGSGEPTTVPPGADTKRRIRAALAQARAGMLTGEPASKAPQAAPKTPRNDGQPSGTPQSADPDSEPVTLPSAHPGTLEGKVRRLSWRARPPSWRARAILGGSALLVGGLAALTMVGRLPARPSAAIAWPLPAWRLSESPITATPALLITAAPTAAPTGGPPASSGPAMVPALPELPRVRSGTASPAPSPSGSATAPPAESGGPASDPCMKSFLCPEAEPLPGPSDTDRKDK